MRTIIAIVVATGALLVFAVYATIQESRQWENFKVAHDCKVTSHQKSQTQSGYGIMSNGKSGMVTTTTPATTSWLCSDGVTYTR